MAKWSLQNKTANFDEIMGQFGISAVTARLLVNRGIKDKYEIDEFIRPTVESLHKPEMMKNMCCLADILENKIVGGKKIRVIGDYDADGIMSTYILVDSLRRLGADADYYIPDRVKDGYGINEDMIEVAYEDGIDTILTCDNGIAAVGPAEKAREKGITLLVTDHHELPDVLPNAEVIVDPKQPGETYPCRDICGAVVASKLARYLLEKKGKYDTSQSIPYIEFMAIATVCDIVPLTGENHSIVRLGLERLNRFYKGKKVEDLLRENQNINAGLLALMNVCELDAEINEYHFGFVLGPCFNATGRLDLASKALQLLLEKNPVLAYEYASECRKLNEERKNMTHEATEKALNELKTNNIQDRVLVVEIPDCHESLAGIIAGRIRESFCRPVIVFTNAKEGMKGSGRSIPEYNMFEELKKVDDLFTKYGGHPMAAGVSLPTENVAELRRRLNENCVLTEHDMMEKVLLDMQISFNLFTPQILEEINMLAPFGQGNPTPLFGEKNLRIKQMRYIGKNRNYLKFTLINEFNKVINAIYFGDATELLDSIEKKHGTSEVEAAFSGLANSIKLTVAYYPQLNEYNGMSEIQMRIKNYLVQ